MVLKTMTRVNTIKVFWKVDKLITKFSRMFKSGPFLDAALVYLYLGLGEGRGEGFGGGTTFFLAILSPPFSINYMT